MAWWPFSHIFSSLPPALQWGGVEDAMFSRTRVGISSHRGTLMESYSNPLGEQTFLGRLPQSQHMDGVVGSSNMSFIDVPNKLQKELLV